MLMLQSKAHENEFYFETVLYIFEAMCTRIFHYSNFTILSYVI
jgi:hypothetical protein